MSSLTDKRRRESNEELAFRFEESFSKATTNERKNGVSPQVKRMINE